MVQSWAGNSDGLFYCTRKYYGDKVEGQQSYFDYLQVNYAQSHVITRYKVCSGKKTHSVVPRSWVVEVSGIPPSHTLNMVRGLCSDDACWWYTLCNFHYRQQYENARSYSFGC